MNETREVFTTSDLGENLMPFYHPTILSILIRQAQEGGADVVVLWRHLLSVDTVEP